MKNDQKQGIGEPQAGVASQATNNQAHTCRISPHTYIGVQQFEGMVQESTANDGIGLFVGTRRKLSQHTNRRTHERGRGVVVVVVGQQQQLLLRVVRNDLHQRLRQTRGKDGVARLGTRFHQSL